MGESLREGWKACACVFAVCVVVRVGRLVYGQNKSIIFRLNVRIELPNDKSVRIYHGCEK